VIEVEASQSEDIVVVEPETTTHAEAALFGN
jgi:hypothetical protein